MQDQEDIKELYKYSLGLYDKAASARVNWEKSDACQIGQWEAGNISSLGGNLR